MLDICLLKTAAHNSRAKVAASVLKLVEVAILCEKTRVEPASRQIVRKKVTKGLLRVKGVRECENMSGKK